MVTAYLGFIYRSNEKMNAGKSDPKIQNKEWYNDKFGIIIMLLSILVAFVNILLQQIPDDMLVKYAFLLENKIIIIMNDCI